MSRCTEYTGLRHSVVAWFLTFAPLLPLSAHAYEPFIIHNSPPPAFAPGLAPKSPTCAIEPVELLERERPLSLADIRLTWPVESRAVTSEFGKRTDPVQGESRKNHRGVDIRCDTGTPVVAAADGIVTYAKTHGRGGLTIKIDHGGELSTRYAHLLRSTVRAGDRIRAGQRIGFSGSSGRVTGPHLHFEVWLGKRPKNPLSIAWRLPQDPFLGPTTTAYDDKRLRSALRF